MYAHVPGRIRRREVSQMSPTSWKPHKSAFTWAEEAQGGEDLLSRLSAPGGERRPFDTPSSCCFSVPDVAAQRGDVVSFSDFWLSGADDRCAAVASAALRGDLEMLKNFCDSNNCSIFISPGVGVEEANLPDVFEHWTLREYVGAGISACRHWFNQAPELALRVVADGWPRINGGLRLCIQSGRRT